MSAEAHAKLQGSTGLRNPGRPRTVRYGAALGLLTVLAPGGRGCTRRSLPIHVDRFVPHERQLEFDLIERFGTDPVRPRVRGNCTAHRVTRMAGIRPSVVPGSFPSGEESESSRAMLPNARIRPLTGIRLAALYGESCTEPCLSWSCSAAATGRPRMTGHPARLQGPRLRLRPLPPRARTSSLSSSMISGGMSSARQGIPMSRRRTSIGWPPRGRCSSIRSTRFRCARPIARAF